MGAVDVTYPWLSELPLAHLGRVWRAGWLAVACVADRACVFASTAAVPSPGASNAEQAADNAAHALFTGGCPGEMALLQVRSRPFLSARLRRFWRAAVGLEETFFPRMIDADSKKADRASPLERFNLASISDPTPRGAHPRSDGCASGSGPADDEVTHRLAVLTSIFTSNFPRLGGGACCARARLAAGI